MLSLPMRYLDLQFGGRQRDIQSWSCVLDLVRGSLESWQTIFLSIGGQVVLISILTYQMSVDVLP